jgi:hypothetical protein
MSSLEVYRKEKKLKARVKNSNKERKRREVIPKKNQKLKGVKRLLKNVKKRYLKPVRKWAKARKNQQLLLRRLLKAGQSRNQKKRGRKIDK